MERENKGEEVVDGARWVRAEHRAAGCGWVCAGGWGGDDGGPLTDMALAPPQSSVPFPAHLAVQVVAFVGVYGPKLVSQ